ncbi:hypothetical protein BEL04_19010 [Mucilaginibacter sp. PPCGB 2223]|uniref:VanZ family protein n=1 Tax=Mucilaginibacter sp. PPCGB 2223 TaxID=1886027 RepID=UPI000826D6CF|nr:VanZ family protein [Mucilaginibacter sp. PPCGB 2223]OCX50821.1 hypothetical protein BEL04_19010 [Mucilaginibacter sp. PPCGB 2223]
MLHQLIKPALVIFSLALPLWIILRLIINGYKKQQVSPGREFLLFVCYVYFIGILLLTVVPIPMTRHPTPKLDRINFVPVVHTFREFVATFSRGRSFMKILALENVLGNIVLFFPLGVLLPLISPRLCSFKQILLIAFLASTAIEFIQFISQHFGNYRSVDIDDVILNTLGAVLGFVIAGKPLARNNNWP